MRDWYQRGENVVLVVVQMAVVVAWSKMALAIAGPRGPRVPHGGRQGKVSYPLGTMGA